MKTDSELIAERLEQLIDERNITINRLATISALQQSSVNSIFRGQSASPKINTLRKIAEGLDISLIELLDFPPYNERPDGSSAKKEMDKWEQLGNALTPQEKERVRRILSGE